MNKENPLVSICIPVYNGADMISRALESALHQTYEHLEVIVADNASTDATREVVLGLHKRDQRVRYLRNDSNIGLIRNYLKAFELARGDFVQILPHDDWLSRHYIERGVAILKEHPETGAVFSTVLAFTPKEDGTFELVDNVVMPKPGLIPTDYFFRNTYRSQIGANDILSLMRTRDVREVMPRILHMVETAPHRALYEAGFVIDRLFLPFILSQYRSFIYTNRSVFIKIAHQYNVGNRFKAGLLGRSRTQMDDAFRACFEYAYATALRPYLSSFRINIGINRINDFVADVIKSGFPAKLIHEVSRENVKILFRGYSAYEKVMVGLGVVPDLLFRAAKYAVRKAVAQLPEHSYPVSELFLDSQGRFSTAHAYGKTDIV